MENSSAIIKSVMGIYQPHVHIGNLSQHNNKEIYIYIPPLRGNIKSKVD